jgi:hypothetical protein
MVQADAVVEVADCVLDLGLAAVVGFELERGAVAVGDEGPPTRSPVSGGRPTARRACP